MTYLRALYNTWTIDIMTTSDRQTDDKEVH